MAVQKPTDNCVCVRCGKPFHQKPSRVAAGKGKFCSRLCQYGSSYRGDLTARFAARVGEQMLSGCILWTGNVHCKGYGTINADNRRSQPLLAHRVAWELAHGPVPEGLHVLHRCDVRLCVNAAEHLFLGTIVDNNADMVAKDRHARGERNRHAKLTPELVREIRRRAAAGEFHRVIASSVNVTRACVSNIVRREQWKHVAL